MTEQENEHADEPHQPEKNYGQYRPGLVDHGQNLITVGDDPLLKRLFAKHGDRRY